MAKLPKKALVGAVSTYTSATTRFFIKPTGSAKKRGTIYLRLTVNGQRAPDRSTGISIAAADWNSKEQHVSNNDPESQSKNARLQKIRTMIYEAESHLERKNEPITGRKLVDSLFGKKAVSSLYDVYSLFIAESKATKIRSPNTYQGYEKYYRNVSTYFTLQGYTRPLLDDVTKDLFQRLLVWLNDRYVQDYTIKNAQFLKSLFHYAHANGIIPNNPLTTIRLEKSGNYDTTHLTQEQVQQLAAFDFSTLNLPLDSIRVLDEERDVFVFCCYTGLHHADYSKGAYSVSEENGRTWISGHRIKSQGGRKDKPYSMPLHPLAIAILKKYGSVKNLPKRNNAKRNVLLKQIAAYACLNVHLTTKIARKTLAHYCLNVLGMRAETSAAVLGHSSTKTLKHYATISNESIDREMRF
jgi:site-specific recombinase XerD